MDITQLYVTFTHPKVVTSMLLLGIGLGIVLSLLLRYLAGQWYMPAAFVAICTVTAILYMYLARPAGLAGRITRAPGVSRYIRICHLLGSVSG